MSKGLYINKVQVYGRLGKDPEIKQTQGGTDIASFSIATTYERKDANGNKIEETEWHNCVFFGKRVPVIEQYVHKGDKFMVLQRGDMLILKKLRAPSMEDFDKMLKKSHAHAKKHGLTEKDLQEAKQRVIGLQKVSSEESVSVMSELLFSELSGKAEDYYAQENKIKSVSLSQVKSLAKSIVKSYSTASIVPK